MCGFSVTMTAMRGAGGAAVTVHRGCARDRGGGTKARRQMLRVRARKTLRGRRARYTPTPPSPARQTNPAREYSPRPTPPRRWFPPTGRGLVGRGRAT